MSAYKWCIFKDCSNTSVATPGKIFFSVPKGERRLQWYARCNTDSSSLKATKYCCEDHFQLEEDVENWTKYNLSKLCRLDDVIPKLKMNALPRIDSLKSSGNSSDGKILDIMEVDIPPENSCVKDELGGNFGSVVQNFEKRVMRSIGTQTEITGDQSSNEARNESQTGEVLLLPKKRKIFEDFETSFSQGSSSTEPARSSDSSFVVDEKDLTKVNQGGLQLNLFSKLNIEVMEKNSKLYLGIEPTKICAIDHFVKATQCDRIHILICLRKIRLNENIEVLADIVGCNKSSISRIIGRTIPILASYLDIFIYWPDPKIILANLPVTFQANYSKTQSIIDCFEVEVEKPSDPAHQALTYSSYKSCNTAKYLLSMTPDGHINFISRGFGGRTTDETMVKESGYLNVLRPKALVMADRGFKHIEQLLHKQQCSLARPPSVKTGCKMTEKEVSKAKAVAALRSHVERCINSLREFSFLAPHARVHHGLLHLSNHIVTIACALVNLQGPFIL